MKKLIKLAAAVGAALATQYASAGFVTLYGDGGSIQMPSGATFQVASVYENIVTAPGQELKGFGEIALLDDQVISTLCSGCELTFTFEKYFVKSISSTGATFTGGEIKLYLGFGANNDFNPSLTANSAADIAAASNGALFLTLKGHDIDVAGVTLKSTVNSGDLLSPAFNFSGSGLWDVDTTGLGSANGNFNTDSFLAAFGGPTADLKFNTSGDTTKAKHASTECVPNQGQPGTGAACVGGSADIGTYVIPEPGTLALAGLGLMGLGFGAKRRKAA